MKVNAVLLYSRNESYTVLEQHEVMNDTVNVDRLFILVNCPFKAYLSLCNSTTKKKYLFELWFKKKAFNEQTLIYWL